MSKLSSNSAEVSASQAFALLDKFFSEKKIKDYTDAAKFGRENSHFDEPEVFNEKMGALFKVNSTDVYPENPKNYQAVIFNTSGIDVFMERLAFLSRLAKSHKIEAEEVISLVGNHTHREDLMNPDYISKLPRLFAGDFDLTSFDEAQAFQNIQLLMKQKKWNHKDGMEVAWQLVSCDSDMKRFKERFHYFSGNSDTPLRTEELIEHLIVSGLRKPIAVDSPIAFVSNAQGAAKTIEMVKKYFPNSDGSVDVLVARPAAEGIEAKLFNDMPQQRAMTKLFHFYRILETVTGQD